REKNGPTMITLLRLRKRNRSKGHVPVLDSGGICITSLGRGSTWTTASGLRLFRNWTAGQRLKDGAVVFGPTRRRIRSQPSEQLLEPTAMAMAIATATVRATTAPASFARSSRWNERWGNACIAGC